MTSTMRAHGHDVDDKRTWRGQVGFFFCLAALSYLLLEHGLHALLWRDAIYVSVATFASALTFGYFNWVIIQHQKQRAKETELRGISETELLQQYDMLALIFTVSAIAIGLSVTHIYDELFPR